MKCYKENQMQREVRLLEKQGFNPEQWIVAWSDCEILEVVSKRSHRRWKIKKENRKRKM